MLTAVETNAVLAGCWFLWWLWLFWRHLVCNLGSFFVNAYVTKTLAGQSELDRSSCCLVNSSRCQIPALIYSVAVERINLNEL